MRWYWIDRFLEFESGSRAVAVKNVTLAEEHLEEMTPVHPSLPSSLIVEGCAQTAGLLVGEFNQFQERVVLAKVAKAFFHGLARPGDTLRYEATVSDIRDDGAIVSAKVRRQDDFELADIELVFAHLDERFEGIDLFYPAAFLAMLRVLRLFEVGVTADGQPIEVPPHLLEAEAAYMAAQ